MLMAFTATVPRFLNANCLKPLCDQCWVKRWHCLYAEVLDQTRSQVQIGISVLVDTRTEILKPRANQIIAATYNNLTERETWHRVPAESSVTFKRNGQLCQYRWPVFLLRCPKIAALYIICFHDLCSRARTFIAKQIMPTAIASALPNTGAEELF
jgi:hypothetical protein